MNLKLKIWLILGLVMAVLTGLSTLVDYREIDQRARMEMHKQALDLRAALMATRRVYHKQFLASGLPLNDQTLGFLPAHAMSRIAQDYPNWTTSGVRFNNVSDRPRNPANRADADELAAMAWFRANPKAEEYTGTIRDEQGRGYFHFAAPIWTEPYCLTCHAAPESSPPTIRRQYREGYGYRVGDLLGVLSIRIPSEEGHRLAIAQWRQQLVQQVGLLLALMIILALLLNRYVTRRILDMHRASARIAKGDYSFRLADGKPDEIGELARGLNTMAGAIEQRDLALQRSEARYHALFENMQSGFALHRIVTDSDGRPVDYVFLMANPAYYEVTGLPEADLIGRRVSEVLPDIHKDSTDWIGLYGRVAQEGTPIRFETYSDVLEKWFGVVAYQPEPGLFATLVTNISAARKTQQALAESEEKYRILADYSSEWEYWLGPDGRYRYVSPACMATCGHSPEEFLADPGLMERLLHPDDLPAWLGHLQAHAAPGQHTHKALPLRIRIRDGSYRWIEHVCTDVFDSSGRCLGRRGVNHDITERKRGEELERFSAFQAGIAEMSTSILHNIGNAITAVTQDTDIINHAGAELLRVASLLEANAARSQEELSRPGTSISELAVRQCAIQHEAARAIQRLYEDDLSQRTRRLSEGVRHIADIVRIQQSAALPDAHRSSFSLSQAIHSALDMQGDTFSKRGIQVTVAIDPAVDLVSLSHNRMLQALINVIRNSLEAMSEPELPEGFKGRLSIRAEPLGEDRLRLSVQDNGVGFDPDTGENLFRFGFSTKQRGTGFGLHSVAVFAQETGGQVSLTSAGHGQGALLMLDLPLRGGSNGENKGKT